MGRKNRQSLHPLFKGMWADGREFALQFRMSASMETGQDQETGPVYTMWVPATALLADDICNAANTAHQEQLIREKIGELEWERGQEPLF